MSKYLTSKYDDVLDSATAAGSSKTNDGSDVLKKYESYYSQGVLAADTSLSSKPPSTRSGVKSYLSTKTEPLLDLIKGLDLDDEEKTATVPIPSNKYGGATATMANSGYETNSNNNKSLDESTAEAINAVLSRVDDNNDYNSTGAVIHQPLKTQQSSSVSSILSLKKF